MNRPLRSLMVWLSSEELPDSQVKGHYILSCIYGDGDQDIYTNHRISPRQVARLSKLFFYNAAFVVMPMLPMYCNIGWTAYSLSCAPVHVRSLQSCPRDGDSFTG